MKPLVCLSALLLAFNLSAEVINTEIAIQRELVPEQRAATRLMLMPELVLPKIEPVRLRAAERTEASEIPAYLARLQPVNYATSRDSMPYRGYLDAGYFPLLKYNVSVGYAVVDRAKTRLNMFGQFNGNRYKAHDVENFTEKENAGNIGVSLWQKVGRSSLLTADVDYMIGQSYGIGSIFPLAGQNLPVNRVNADVAYSYRPESLFFIDATGRFSRFSYGKAKSEHIEQPALNQTQFAIDLHGGLRVSGNAYVVMDLGFENMSTTSSVTQGLVHLNPYVSYVGSKFTGRLGLKADVRTGSSGPSLIAPDIMLAWTPSCKLSIWGKMDGYMYANTLSSVYSRFRYIRPESAMAFSRVPLRFDVGVTVLPIQNLRFEVYARYASVEDWVAFDAATSLCRLGQKDTDGFLIGGKISYQYRQLFDISLKYDCSLRSEDMDSGYYLWDDRAKSDLTASLTVRPIRQLRLTADYEWRADRNLTAVYNTERLGDVSALDFTVHYDFTSRLGAFVKGENLLNHRYYIIPNILSQGINGLVGVTYKF